MMLIKLITDGIPVMYFDETSFQLEMTVRKAFYTRQNKLVMPIPRGRRKGFSLYGCIGSCITDGAYFEVHDSSNKEDFMSFMRNHGTASGLGALLGAGSAYAGAKYIFITPEIWLGWMYWDGDGKSGFADVYR